MPSAAGPDLPPHLLAKRKRLQEQQQHQEPPNTSPQAPQASTDDLPASPKRARVAGPSLPPSASLADKPLTSPSLNAPHSDSHSDSDSDSDSDYGPAPPSATAHATALAASTHADSYNSDSDTGTGVNNPQSQSQSQSQSKRDEWMTLPPTADSLSRLADPARQRARGFQTGPRAGNRGAAGSAPGAAWTETAEQKRKRLADAVLGIVGDEGGSGGGKGSGPEAGGRAEERRRLQDRETARRIKEARGPSLMEEHAAAKNGRRKDKEEDDPSKRGFDWEKDMKYSNVLGQGQKKEMVGKAASGFSSKFSGGGFL